MLKLGENRNFTVVSFGSAAICGGVFVLRSGKWHLQTVSSQSLAGAKDAAAPWRELWRELRGGGDLVVVTGAVPGGVFFSLDTLALPYREQREALLMELPRQMLRPPHDPAIQFLPVGSPDEEGMARLNVYAFESAKLGGVLATLRRSGLLTDALIHPLLSVGPGDPAVYLPGIDREFYFRSGRFHRVSGAEEELERAKAEWAGIADGLFARDVEVDDLADLLPVFIVARFVISGGFRQHRGELIQTVPGEFRPVRYRHRLRLTAALAVALAAVLAWQGMRGRWHDFSGYRAVSSECESLKSDTARMQGALRRATRSQKDIAKVVDSSLGERDIIGQLAAFSKVLPQDVMVSEFRWSENGIDLTLQSESENLDLPGLIKPLRRWRVADIHQRQGRFSVATTINVKLVPYEQQDSVKNKGKGKAAKGGKGARGGRR